MKKELCSLTFIYAWTAGRNNCLSTFCPFVKISVQKFLWLSNYKIAGKYVRMLLTLSCV